jgi:hypothetical protein
VGRKRDIVGDTLDLPVKRQVTAATVPDRGLLAPRFGAAHRKRPWATPSVVDGDYQDDEAQRAAYEASRASVTVVKRTDAQVEGFIVLPKRRLVEGTPGWANRTQRLSKDFEAAKIFARTAAAGSRRGVAKMRPSA